MHRAFIAIALACMCVALGGCRTPHGVEMINQTGRTLTVEYLHVRTDGSMSPYSTAILTPDGHLKHHPAVEPGYAGERVRLAVQDSPSEVGHSIVLHIPEGPTRDYDIQYISGRLVAREHKKGRDWKRVGEPDFGE